MGGRRGGTREKIRTVALELFAEQGYEKTSLREISERLGVTKAALYYHFNTKEEIVSSLVHDVQAEVEEIIEWARGLPPTLESRQAILRRYVEIMRGPGGRLVRFLAENGPAIRHLKSGDEARARFLTLARLLSNEDASVPDQLRARLSVFIVHMGIVATRDMDISDDERLAAILEVALDLVSRAHQETAPADRHAGESNVDQSAAPPAIGESPVQATADRSKGRSTVQGTGQSTGQSTGM